MGLEERQGSNREWAASGELSLFNRLFLFSSSFCCFSSTFSVIELRGGKP